MGQAGSPAEEAIADLFAAGQAAFPDVRLEASSFAAHVARITHATQDVVVLRSLHGADLYLALGCALGLRPALDAFASRYGDEVRRAAAKSRLRVDDLEQLLAQRLFVAGPGDDGAPRAPRITEYAGQGELRAWVRVAVARLTIDRARTKSGNEALAKGDDGPGGWGIPSPADDPELDYLKRLYRHEFAVAFEEALGTLDVEQRNALRYQFAERLGIDQIAAIHGIHRATAARRLAQAREALLAETRRRLSNKLRLSHRELESVIRMIESQLHVSVSRLLA